MAERKLDPDFFQMVYQVVGLIPKSRVTSYGAIARYLGAPGAARIVGYAMNGSHSQKKKVPAHRVVNSKGVLTGKHHFKTPFEMQALLEKEGISIKKDTIVDFSKFYWDPMKELKI